MVAKSEGALGRVATGRTRVPTLAAVGCDSEHVAKCWPPMGGSWPPWPRRRGSEFVLRRHVVHPLSRPVLADGNGGIGLQTVKGGRNERVRRDLRPERHHQHPAPCVRGRASVADAYVSPPCGILVECTRGRAVSAPHSWVICVCSRWAAPAIQRAPASWSPVGRTEIEQRTTAVFLDGRFSSAGRRAWRSPFPSACGALGEESRERRSRNNRCPCAVAHARRVGAAHDGQKT